MNFDYLTESIHTNALTLEHFLVPWDTEIIGYPVAEISRLEVSDERAADQDYREFASWRDRNEVILCSCRLPAERLKESMFLEKQGFRFIELNYMPALAGLQNHDIPEDDLNVGLASINDQEILAEMAGEIFQHGRFHQDPELGNSIGDQRYRMWMVNSFENPKQTVIKCTRRNEIIGFFVVEYPNPNHCFWSLAGLKTGLQGQGLGKRVWKSLMKWHQSEGIDTISTSITSHNIAVFNLYVSLGFRFPAPLMTFHWTRSSEVPPH